MAERHETGPTSVEAPDVDRHGASTCETGG
jgi:hypothetical protein